MTDALEFLSHAHPHLGIPEAPDLAGKPPVFLRQMNRRHLAMLFADLGYRTGAEVGVWRGAYSRVLWETNPEATVYCVDPWEIYDRYPEQNDPRVIDEAYERTLAALDGTGCVIVREHSMEAVKRFADGELDFVYIDGNHAFEYVTNDIAEWGRKVRTGGIVAGHDYARYKSDRLCHVKSVVSGWTYAHKIRPWFVTKGGKYPDWFWVKQC